MKHRFYIKFKKEQNKFQLRIGIVAFTVVIFALWISYVTSAYAIVAIVTAIALSMVAPFFDTPTLKKNGHLRYHSLLFISEKPKNGVITIHGGTLFDYVFVIDFTWSGTQRTNFILQQYLEGLLHLLEENKTDENTIIRGTSYIINERTAQRMGFTVAKTDYLQKLLLLYNYFNISTTYSIAKGKVALPQLSQTKTFETTIHKLLQHKDFIGAMNEKLKKNAHTPRSK